MGLARWRLRVVVECWRWLMPGLMKHPGGTMTDIRPQGQMVGKS